MYILVECNFVEFDNFIDLAMILAMSIECISVRVIKSLAFCLNCFMEIELLGHIKVIICLFPLYNRF